MGLSEIPDGLGAMQYAAKLCEDLSLPARGNVPMIGEAIEAVSKGRLFRGRTDALKCAYYWLSRRALVAEEQGEKVTSLWFHRGDYKNVQRPEGPQTPRHYCGECLEGWVKVFEGKTAGGHKIDHKYGAMTRCVCWRNNV